ncbi:MAG: DUF928 domain-containing protein, partial [Trichodesmium sp. St18_bin1]|nr:DUF928 domain-containing protein [Trichodesmium sp. St18_bin1]
AWSVASLIIYSPSGQGQEPSLILNSDSVKVKLLSEKKTDKKNDSDNTGFDGTGRPKKQRRAGSKHPDCPKVDSPMTALLPEDKRLTVSNSPTFWFYIPYNFQDVKTGQFVLQDEEGERDIYRTTVNFSDTPGIVSIPLPDNLPENLEIERPYLWLFLVFCNPEDTDANVVLEGYVQRVNGNSNFQIYSDYANQGIWHDALTDLAERLRREPQEPELKEDWKKFLKAFDLENLAEEPILPCCTPEK